jgi:hypothetical protein
MKKKTNAFFAAAMALTLLLIPTAVLAAPLDDEIPPSFPNGGMSWGFDKGDVFGWTFSSILGTFDIYGEINDTRLLEDPTGNGVDYYGVVLDMLYYNHTQDKLVPNPEESGFVASLLSFNESDMIPFLSDGFIANAFVPKNGSGDLALEWCAVAMMDHYEDALVMDENSTYTYTVTDSSIHYEVDGEETYIDLTYDSAGVLTSATIKAYAMGSNPTRIEVRRLTENFNPVDDLKWGVEIGDEILYSLGGDEIKVEITNITREYMPIGVPVPLFEAVSADHYDYNKTTDKWDFVESVYVGMANERSPLTPFMMIGDGRLPYLVPSGTTAEDISTAFAGIEGTSDFEEVEFEDNWMKFVGEGDDYAIVEYGEDGILEYIQSKGVPPFGIDSLEDKLSYRKFATIADNATHFDLTASRLEHIAFSATVESSGPVEVRHAALKENPTGVELNGSCTFIDIATNDTAALGPVNITVDYDPLMYDALAVYHFNETSGEWEEIGSEDDNETLTFTAEDLSVFALTGDVTPYPPDFDLTSDAGEPDGDGSFTLTWEESEGAEYYAIYVSRSPITGLDDEGLELVVNGTTDLNHTITDYASGTYHFVVVAVEGPRKTMSNPIKVTVNRGIFENILAWIIGLIVVLAGIISALLYFAVVRKDRCHCKGEPGCECDI